MLEWHYESFEKLPILSIRLKGEILTDIQSLRFLVANAPRNDKIQSFHYQSGPRYFFGLILDKLTRKIKEIEQYGKSGFLRDL